MKQIMLLLLIVLMPTAALAQHAHGAQIVPKETGQDAFAAISEIVSQLQADPATDWSTISIDALRAHLVDMNRVTLMSDVQSIRSETMIAFNVTGQGKTVSSIQRMTTAHAPMLAAQTGWTIRAIPTDHGATLQISAADKGQLQKIAGLGFFGVMTIGAHHQAHHMMIAMGHNPH